MVAQLSVEGCEFWIADESPEHQNFSPETLGGGIRTRFSNAPSPSIVRGVGGTNCRSVRAALTAGPGVRRGRGRPPYTVSKISRAVSASAALTCSLRPRERGQSSVAMLASVRKLSIPAEVRQPCARSASDWSPNWRMVTSSDVSVPIRLNHTYRTTMPLGFEVWPPIETMICCVPALMVEGTVTLI